MNFRLLLANVAFVASTLLLTGPAAVNGTEPEPPPAFLNPELPTATRVDDLIARLTVEEKIGQLMKNTPAIPRLDIPAYSWWSEALHGMARNGPSTVFPQAIALAATWNPELHEKIADVIATEIRAKNNETIRRTGGETHIYEGLTIWSPNINIFRDPRWGRGQETYGEDPFLTARMAVAFIHGLQGNDPHYLKTVATVKHYAVHSGPEPLRHRFNAVVSARDLHETYLPAFEAGIREGGAWSLMSAYNAVDNIPAPANTLLLKDILRGEWGFQGAVVGDVDNVADMWKPGTHEYAKDAAEASAIALRSGNDLCSGTTYAALPAALQRGLVAEADLDTALRRLFLLRFKLGQFDPPERVPFRQIPASEINAPAHDALALEAARQSLVLLKNDGSLPWNPRELKTVAILGPTADDNSTVLGNYAGSPVHPVNLLQGLRAKLESLGVKVIHDPAVPLVEGFREAGQPFPAGTLFTDDTRSVPGLKGEVFDNEQFTGTPRAVRTDAQLDLLWNEAQPVADLPPREARVRWTGVLVAPQTGDYTLALTVNGNGSLFLDDQLVIDDKPSGDREGTTSRSMKRPLTAGQSYRVRVEYQQRKSDATAQVRLGWRPPGSMADAVAKAATADHIVLALGITPNLEGEEMPVAVEGFKGGDRTSVLLPRSQRDLLDAVAALGKPFVVVLTNGSALSFDVSKPNAILEAWYYGQRGGDAVAEALVGDCNPGGRLPITFYESENDLPSFEDYGMANRTYRYFPGKPLYAFGHGLSYTTFAYKKVAFAPDSKDATVATDVQVELQNTGARAGDEVIQIYARAVHPNVPRPVQWLVGFQRVRLAAGEQKTVTIPVRSAELRRWDESSNRYVVDAGEYEIRVGPASDHIVHTEVIPLPRIVF